MNITCLLEKVDPLIQSIAKLYRNRIPFYDYDDLVQEGRLVVLESLRRYLRKQVEINPASISSWAYIAVTGRFKELASYGAGVVSGTVIDNDNCGEISDTGFVRMDEGSRRHIQHICRLTQNNVVPPLLQDVLTPRDVAVQIERTSQRVTQLQKEFIKDWEEGLEKNGGETWKKKG